jgi:hypothetical protein
VKWGRAVVDRQGKPVRVSKCERYRVVTRQMASGRSGYFNARAYEAQRANGSRIGKLQDSLADALDAVEFEHDPNWEPE